MRAEQCVGDNGTKMILEWKSGVLESPTGAETLKVDGIWGGCENVSLCHCKNSECQQKKKTRKRAALFLNNLKMFNYKLTFDIAWCVVNFIYLTSSKL